jgi:hypothetical protein
VLEGGNLQAIEKSDFLKKSPPWFLSQFIFLNVYSAGGRKSSGH